MAITDIDGNNYEENVILSVNPVAINLYMPGMIQCEKNEKVLDEIVAEYSDYLRGFKVNLMKQPSLTELFEVDTIPQIIMMDGGIIIKRIYGNPTKEALIEELELETIKEFRAKGIYYKPKRNYIPGYIINE